MRQVFRLWINVIFILFTFFFLALYFHFYFHFFFALLLLCMSLYVCVCVPRQVTPPRAVCLTGASKFDEFLNLKSLFVHF